jgi:GTP pyrophosphokinase/guanosine-3',5'-bis(diphosphate) 3'-pyrophosphohydrolase
MTLMLAILRAATYAAAAHVGQTRRSLPDPYINHPLRVAEHAARAGLDEAAIVAALLHDVVEDTTLTWDDLRAAGFPERAITVARLLTKWWEAGDDDTTPDKGTYYAHILEDADALALKLLDRADNMQDVARIVGTRREFAEKYLKKTRREFPPLYERCRNAYARDTFVASLAGLEQALDRRR